MTQPNPKPVVLISAGHTLQPLWPLLTERYALLFVGDQRSFGLAKDTGIDCAWIGQFATPDVNENSVNAGYMLAADLYNDEIGNEIERLAGDNPPPQLSASSAGKWWPAMIGEQARQRIMLIEMLKIAFLNHKIAGCVVHEDVTPDMRTMVEFCKSRGVPTVHVPHANCYYKGESWDIHTESICDYIACGGDYAKRFYARWGFDETRIHATGTPNLDSWYTLNPPTKEESRQVLGIGQDEFVLVYASSWSQLTSTRSEFETEHRRDLAIVIEAAKKLKATLLIKMHPGEAPDMEKFYLENLQQNGVRGLVTRQYNEYVLRIGNCVLISQGPSNINIPAVICGVPSLYLPTEDFGFERGPIMIGENVIDAIAIAKGMSKEYWQEWLDDVNCNGGSGTEVTSKFIMEKFNDQALQN